MANNQYTLNDLCELIKEVMDIKDITPRIRKHINQLILEHNMTFKEIARCIVWYDEVFGGKFNVVYGIISIVNYREQANKYFQQLELDQQKQLAEAQKIVEYQDNNIIFNIGSLKHKKREPKQFNIQDVIVEGDE
jgi:hypothetical protein